MAKYHHALIMLTHMNKHMVCTRQWHWVNNYLWKIGVFSGS